MSDQKTNRDKTKIKFATNNIKQETQRESTEEKQDINIEGIKAFVLKDLIDKKQMKISSLFNSNGASHNSLLRDIKYEELTNKYNSEIFSHRIFMFICKIISNNKIAKTINILNPLYIVLVKISKLLLMTEIDLVVFSILVQKFGWKEIENLIKCNDIFSILLNFCIISKKKSSDSSEIIINSVFKENPSFEAQYKDFINLNVNKNDISMFDVSIKEINDKHVELSKPFNICCKEEIIDYNFCVDQILSMSMPYSENRKTNNMSTNHITSSMMYCDPKIENDRFEKGKIFYVNNPNQNLNNQNLLSNEFLIKNIMMYRNESYKDNPFILKDTNHPILNRGNLMEDLLKLNPDCLQNKMSNDFSGNYDFNMLLKNVSNQNHAFPEFMNNDSFLSNNNYLGKKREELEMMKINSSHSNILYNEHKNSNLFLDYGNSSKFIK